MINTKRVGIVIPAYRAEAQLRRLLKEIEGQTCPFVRRLLIDSSSEDRTAELAGRAGWEVVVIPRADFNHGGTRGMGVERLKGGIEFVVFLTQDVRLPDRDAIRRLIESFDDPEVGAAYGRQLPHLDADYAARLQRAFHYPAQSRKQTRSDIARCGLRAAFLSDSFAAYRIRALEDAGGFPRTPICEDILLGARLLQAGWAIQYRAEAVCRHSHNFAWRETWQRYRQMGAFYARAASFFSSFGAPEHEGRRLLLYQLRHALRDAGTGGAVCLLLEAFVKYAAYRTGAWQARR